MDEGMADLIEWYQEYNEESALLNTKYPCSYANNLKELEKLNPPKSNPAYECNYSLGVRLFLDLLFTMEDQPFIEGARKLYQITTESNNKAGIQAVQRAFGDTERTNNWYNSQNPKANFATDTTAPTWKLPEIQVTIESAGITLTPRGQTVSSFSSKPRNDPVWLEVHHKHPQFNENERTVPLTLVQLHDDNVPYNTREIELTVKGIHVGGTVWHSVGQNAGKKWKPGLHRAIIYDRNGVKIAEVTWEVTP